MTRINTAVVATDPDPTHTPHPPTGTMALAV